MNQPGSEELLYFAGEEFLLPVYFKLREEVLDMFPDSEVRVQKSQITFRWPHPYVWIWTLAGHGSRKPGSGPMFVTFAAPFPIESPLIHTKVEPYPGRWTHHVAVREPGDITKELMMFIQTSYAFRNAKKLKNNKEE